MLPAIIVGFAMITLGVALLLLGEVPFLGGKKIPELAKGLGEGIRNFKDSLKGPEDQPPTSRPDEKKQA